MKPMNLKTFGMLAVMGLGAVASAQAGQGSSSQGQMQQEQHAQKSKDSMSQAKEKNLTGKVVEISKDQVYLEGKEGEVISLAVSDLARVNGQMVTSTDREQILRSQIRPGEEVRTSFSRGQDKNGKPENKASSIEKK